MTTDQSPEPGSDELLSVLIADDEAVVRETISIYVSSAPDMQVVGTAADGRAAVQMAETLRPDIILMDIQMPRVDGVEAVAEVLRLLPRTHVVMITTFTSREAVVPALRAGALGYVLKSDPPERLLSAVREAVAGRTQLSPEALEAVVGHLRESDNRASLPASVTLTARESEVLNHLAEGHSNREIAELMVLSEKSVKLHVTNMVSKFQVRDRLQLVIAAHKAGLIQL
ncbi:response regulator transcription factor [Kocuria palustris]|jgi:NarL family two-component system response regulator LiaR|uniref:response regulator n=1 Tax=Kocuria palustris TaxID=71999 RepID=UPI0019D295FC|nr:response regulator transcription factor [Kocuria palustris]MBN6754226.1 response regulator transcription factor [Kocuria palustris]MBN6758293.1 response regulator transcription factor [Kocuria palustris]MBN6763321.1 response regulator transcription factor [Kocuria palustris]MBN6783281.1 response regulator transcription factor [Kocuria palustris]MBN6798834.1 response regulator transcription factor [Kocuria palustris]